jgi:hypothetical protein
MPGPMNTEYAVRAVARRVLAEQIERHLPDWEDYPDIGEHDWARVVARVRWVAEANDLQTEHYAAAYQHLVDRAGGREVA